MKLNSFGSLQSMIRNMNNPETGTNGTGENESKKSK